MLVRALKSFRAGSGAKLMRPGDEVEVNDELAETLLDRGIAVAADAHITAGESADDIQDPEANVKESNGEAEEADLEPEDEPEPDVEEQSGYPPLPKKAATLSEWEEYARRNEISLTNLRSRNEKIGYIQKVVSGK